MANQFSKAKIDFDVYERADPESQIDWGKEAKVISDSFANVAKTRGDKKAALEKAFQAQQDELNNLGEYDNTDVQSVVMNAGQDGANKLLDMKNMMKRGLVKPADVTMFQQKQLSGFTLLKKNLKNFDNTFKEYTTRLQTNMEGSDLPEGAPGEQWLAKQLEGFANMNNVSVQTDPETGNVSMLRLDKDGKPVPGSSATLNRLTLLMKQKINNFDPNKGLERAKAISGKVIQQQIDSKYGQNAKITTEERSRMETEYYKGTEGQKYLDAEAQSLLADPYDMQSFMLNSNLTTEDGTAFELGDQQQFDDWNADPANKDNEKNNPYLVMEFGTDNVYNAEFTDDQKKTALDAMKTKITGTLDYTNKEDVKGLTQKPQPSAANLASGKEDDAKSSKLGDYIVMLTDPDPVKRAAMEKTLNKTKNDAVDAFNAKVSNDEDKLPKINNISKGTKSVATQEDVDNGLAENIGDEVVTNRVIKLSDGTEIQLEGSFKDQARTLEALYNPDNQLTTDDIERLAKGRDFDLNTEITNTGDSSKTSKKAYAKPDYTTDIQIKGKSDPLSSQAHMDEVFGGPGGSGQFNSFYDSANEIGEEMIKIINGTLDPDMLREFNTTTGMELSFTSSTDGDDSVTFNFGGESFTVGGKNGDLNAGDLYGGNGADLWQALQDNLLDPGIKNLNKERTGGGNNYEL